MIEFLHQFFQHFGPIGIKELGVLASIVVMDAALSGDNSIAISAMCAHLHDNIRQKAIYLGMVFAGLLRFVALGLAGFIISNPWVQILGALFLIHLCVKHFREESDADEGFVHKQKGFFATLISIGFLDMSLSLDNVVAITSMTSNFSVIFIGVALSIAMLAVATKVTQYLMGKFPSIQDAAYVILAFLGLNMLAAKGSEFLIWLGEFLTKHHTSISTYKVDIGEVGTIVGVGIILGMAIIFDSMKKKK
jgi:YjbE family integral membrane protein